MKRNPARIPKIMNKIQLIRATQFPDMSLAELFDKLDFRHPIDLNIYSDKNMMIKLWIREKEYINE